MNKEAETANQNDPTLQLKKIRQDLAASIEAKQEILRDRPLLMQIIRLADACVQSLKGGGKLIFAGNGGSFADAQHVSAEFTSRFMFDREPLSSLALGTNNSALSAIGNDYGYERVFARELKSIARPGDVFVPISTSGNSPNITAATEVAISLGIFVMGWTGQHGGRLKELCECICVPTREIPRVQECHITIGHILCGLVEAKHISDESE